MEEFEPQHLQALSAYVQGLEAALAALHADESSGASLRRLARSLASAADRMGAAGIAAQARLIQEAGDADLEDRTRALLDQVESIRGSVPSAAITILLVEDNRTVATAVKAYLKGEGRTVRHTSTAANAEKILASEHVDLVLLDLMLPDRDGRDLLVQMRENQATAHVPVIVLSAKQGAVARAECLAVGAAEFLEKPVDPKKLRASVAHHARPPAAGVAPTAPRRSPVATRADLVEAFDVRRAGIAGGAPLAAALWRVEDAARIEEAMGESTVVRLVGAVAAELLGVLADGETLGRWERGDLVALLPGRTRAEAQQKLEDALDRLAGSSALEEFQHAGAALSFSAGVSVAGADQDLREVVSAAEEALLKARSGASDEAPIRTGPPRILLVEDDRVTATLIHHRLVREGFEVIDFLNGEDAFTWVADSDFDLAVLDVKVPGMDGFELLERLRAMPRLDHVPIVMLTGLGSEADVIRGLELGANDYMLKPFSPTELLARMRRLLYAAGTSEEGGAP